MRECGDGAGVGEEPERVSGARSDGGVAIAEEQAKRGRQRARLHLPDRECGRGALGSGAGAQNRLDERRVDAALVCHREEAPVPRDVHALRQCRAARGGARGRARGEERRERDERREGAGCPTHRHPESARRTSGGSTATRFDASSEMSVVVAVASRCMVSAFRMV